MGLFSFIGRIFGFGGGGGTEAVTDRFDQHAGDEASASQSRSADQQSSSDGQAHQSGQKRKPVGIREGRPLKRPLPRLRYESSLVPTPASAELHESDREPYAFARFGPFRGTFLDLSQDADPGWLNEFKLPELRTPEDLADFLGLTINELAWLANRCQEDGRPQSLQKWHYTHRWLPKKSGGFRLLEIPKPKLKEVQHKILTGILNKVPAHRSAHGFVKGRSPISNADAHVGADVLYKLDLQNFYGTVRHNRVVAIFRTIGFSREVSMWLAMLTTSLPPYELRPPAPTAYYNSDWYARHLPQGTPTSPALANLSAYSLDVRLTGLARKYGATYTRYADDLTFSGSRSLINGLRQFIPLTEQIVRDERFRINSKKRRVLRSNQRMTVTGVVVNEHLNMSRRDYDRLKAVLHNCVKQGPDSQNRDNVADFEAHLRGRVEYACQLNPSRGAKLRALYDAIRWS